MRDAIVVVPVRPMEGNAAFGDIHHPGHAGEVKSVGGNISGCHVSRGALVVREEISNGRRIGSAQALAAGGDARCKDGLVILIGQQDLLAQSHFDAFVPDGNLRR